MNTTMSLINGFGFGVEYIAKDLEEDIDESVWIIEFLFFRWMIGMGDYE